MDYDPTPPDDGYSDYANDYGGNYAAYEEPTNPESYRPPLLLRLFRARPRLFQRVAPEEVQPQRRLTFWGLMFRLSPAWVLVIAILAMAPALPFRVIGYAARLIRNITNNDAVVVALEQSPLLDLSLSPVFTPEIQFWSEDIAVWALTYDLEVNQIATVMQIESCGDPQVGSPAGANGLFQVMPLHFKPGEEYLNPEDNARAGLSFLAYLLELSNGDMTGALAGYNAGEWAVYAAHEDLPDETQRYIYWGSGIYAEAESEAQTSTRLDEWLNAGGVYLCDGAAETLGLPSSTPDLQ